MILSIITTITGQGLLNLILWIIIIGLIFWLLHWAIGAIGIPEPFHKIARAILIIAAVIIIINLLFALVGFPSFDMPQIKFD